MNQWTWALVTCMAAATSFGAEPPDLSHVEIEDAYVGDDVVFVVFAENDPQQSGVMTPAFVGEDVLFFGRPDGELVQLHSIDTSMSGADPYSVASRTFTTPGGSGLLETDPARHLFQYTCGDQTRVLTPMSASEVESLLGRIRGGESLVVRLPVDRRPWVLARVKSSGELVYVDEDRGGGLRLFVGSRGHMEEVPVRSVSRTRGHSMSTSLTSRDGELVWSRPGGVLWSGEKIRRLGTGRGRLRRLGIPGVPFDPKSSRSPCDVDER